MLRWSSASAHNSLVPYNYPLLASVNLQICILSTQTNETSTETTTYKVHENDAALEPFRFFSLKFLSQKTLLLMFQVQTRETARFCNNVWKIEPQSGWEYKHKKNSNNDSLCHHRTISSLSIIAFWKKRKKQVVRSTTGENILTFSTIKQHRASQNTSSS